VVTDAMQHTINETNRRRAKQLAYNEEHGITPKTIMKTIEQIMQSTAIAEGYEKKEEETQNKAPKDDFQDYLDLDSVNKVIDLLKREMQKAAANLDFERAAELRDRIWEMQNYQADT
ncbi:MAG: UvrB/UvrC motif-containing protein, partial [Candidatus Cloacimonetes bacterium]|nr:UvrB/UvrC motif-containing protein [Candidatus Cloacimonadota bacterium]